jgi:hypothetical protein
MKQITHESWIGAVLFGLLLGFFSYRFYLKGCEVPITDQHKFDVFSLHITSHPWALALLLGGVGAVPFIGGVGLLLQKYELTTPFIHKLFQIALVSPILLIILTYYSLFSRR